MSDDAGHTGSQEQPPLFGPNPERYRLLSQPFPSMEAVEAAFADFTREVSLARERHRIGDVHLILEVGVIVDGQEQRLMVNTHFGDATRGVFMLAQSYGAEEERMKQLIRRTEEHGRKRAKKR